MMVFIFAAPFLRPGASRKGVIEGEVAVVITKIRGKGGNEQMRKDGKIVIDGHAGRLVSNRSIIKRIALYVISAILGFGAMFLAMMLDFRAYAAALPEIFMGTFQDKYTGGDPDEIAQMPETGDVITTPRTVVILGSKWKLKPGFELKSAVSTDSKVVSVNMKKWKAVIKAKKSGKADITLTSVDGETKTYQIIVEDPQVKSLKITDFVRLDESEYITGVKYLKPTSVSVKKRKIGQIYSGKDGKNVLNVFGSGRTKVIVRYGEYKRTGKIKAKLPYMASKDVKLSNRPKRIRIKNVPKGWKPVYRSTNPDVAVCSSGGYVAPKGNGTATIYTKIGNTYLICHVTVEGFKK